MILSMEVLPLTRQSKSSNLSTPLPTRYENTTARLYSPETGTPKKTPHFDKWPVHCVANTRGADFHKDLNIQSSDIIINKGTGQTDGYSGWEGRSDKGETLESIITPKTPHEKVKVFLGGLATDFCVKSTALDIAEHFKDNRRVTTYLLIDAIRAVGLTPTAEEEALSAMKEAGILAISTEEAKKIIQEAI